MRHLVLAGAGHAHALLLRGLARSPLPQTQVTVVSPHALAPYSGMVPGWLAGRYAFDDIVVDFPRLCAAAAHAGCRARSTGSIRKGGACSSPKAAGCRTTPCR